MSAGRGPIRLARLVPALWLWAALGASTCRREAPTATAPVPSVGTAVTVVQTAGTATRTAAGGAQAPAAGPLAAGDLIVTGADGSAVVRLSDGHELDLQPDTRLRVEPGADGEIVLRLESGSILSRLADKPAAGAISLSILTPFGVTRVPRAPGEAAIEVRPDGANIVVAMGEIDFVDHNGRSTRAGAGDQLEVSLGGVQLIPAGVRTVTGEGIDLVLSADRGQLLVRPPGTRRFARQRSVTAAPGTAYRLSGADGRARLVAGSLRARLSGGAEGRLGAAEHAAEADRYELGLARGTALVQLPGGRPQELRVPIGKQDATLRASDPGALRLVRGKQGLTVAVFLGEVEVELGGRRQRLAAGDRVQLSARGLAPVSRAAPAMTLPTARGLQVHADALEEVAVSWPSDLTDARIEVASDPQFTDVMLDGHPGGTQASIPAPARGELYWRVTGQRQGGPTTLLGHARFRPDRGRSVLDLTNPRNLVTETGEITTVYFQSVLPALTFSFAGRPQARRYQLRVYRAGALDRPILQREVASTQCSFEAGALAEGSYLWHAVAVDAEGKQSGGGLMNKLELVYDNALNTLAIGSPKPGARASGREIPVSGIAPIGSKLFVNGQAVPLDEKGRFDLQVQRSSAVVFRLVEHDGSQSYWVRALRPRS